MTDAESEKSSNEYMANGEVMIADEDVETIAETVEADVRGGSVGGIATHDTKFRHLFNPPTESEDDGMETDDALKKEKLSTQMVELTN